jgi:hypothetical protein
MSETEVIETKSHSASGNGAMAAPGEGVPGPGPGQVQVNPVEVARIGLVFLSRIDFRRHERQGFDQLEAMLNAIAQGDLVVARP